MIVATRLNGEIHWFDSDPEYWVLDQHKWAQAFKQAGYEIDVEDHSDRFNIPVVDERSVSTFMSCMEEFSVVRENLRQRFLEALQGASGWFDIADTLPSLFVDFDNRMLWSLQSEGVSFESYIPAGWHGEYEDFFDQLPDDERYWEEDGTNLTNRFKTPQTR